MNVQASTAAVEQVLEGTLQNPQFVADPRSGARILRGTMTVTDGAGGRRTFLASYAGPSPNAAGRYFADGTVRLRGLLDGRNLTVSEIL